MDFAFSAEQRELGDLTRRIVGDLVTDARPSAPAGEAPIGEASAGFDTRLWRTLADAGLLGIALPAEVGGGGYGPVELAGVLVELGAALAPVPVLPTAIAAGAIAAFGDAGQLTDWAARAARGDAVLCCALAEELAAGADPQTTARRDGATWRLTGRKAAVDAAPLADLLLVPASTADGVGVFLVQPDDPGVRLTTQRMVDGDDAGLLELDEARLPEGRLLGSPDGAAARWLHARYLVALCAWQFGVTGAALRLTTRYAASREQFGRPIGSFQAVSQRLADAHIDLQGIRLTMWQAAWLLGEGLPAETAVATAKFWAADAGHRIAHTAVHVHGGVGIDLEGRVHRYFTAAKRIEFALGGATEQARTIGAALAADPV